MKDCNKLLKIESLALKIDVGGDVFSAGDMFQGIS